MLDMDEIQKALQDRVVSAVATHTGLSRNTVAAIKSGRVDRLSHKTQRLLSDYLAPRYEGKQ
jgi:uncharacterized protein YidB (DUF937 family)